MAYEKKSWSEFRETGLFHFVNAFLHLFGWAIVLSEEDDGSTEVFPARTDYRGFQQESNDKAYSRVAEFLRKDFQSAPVEAKAKKVEWDMAKAMIKELESEINQLKTR